MEILFVLVPLSVVLVLLIVAGLWWAVERGQFDDIEQEGERILRGD
ncbi:cbb3-type cytochrome oxidase assembly protein CcoS [Xenophilus azovorans]|nr:cbb3-type cytochrome oxidase assembly protein CcoS [Xenophilus azovorans]